LNTSTSLLLQAAQAAAGHQHLPAGALYVVATPIGNLADLTLRAIHVLATADAVACEDTRVAAGLLRHLGLHKPLLALHAHNEAAAAETVLQRLAAGERVACISDAGTPAVSDPGARVVARAAAAGHRVVPVPGPSSALAALSVAGDTEGEGFRFSGFLPAQGAARQQALDALLRQPGTQVLFEAPHRIAALLQALAEAAPTRRLTLARELTKQFEDVVTLATAEAPAWLAADPHRHRGEFVLVLHALPRLAGDDATLPAAAQHALRALLDALPLKQAVALAAQISGAPRNALYAQALVWREAARPQAPEDEGPDGARVDS
jgi:16S rRNA (cytidine1402-2'-O)-methyltransferase